MNFPSESVPVIAETAVSWASAPSLYNRSLHALRSPRIRHTTLQLTTSPGSRARSEGLVTTSFQGTPAKPGRADCPLRPGPPRRLRQDCSAAALPPRRLCKWQSSPRRRLLRPPAPPRLPREGPRRSPADGGRAAGWARPRPLPPRPAGSGRGKPAAPSRSRALTRTRSSRPRHVPSGGSGSPAPGTGSGGGGHLARTPAPRGAPRPAGSCQLRRGSPTRLEGRRRAGWPAPGH